MIAKEKDRVVVFSTLAINLIHENDTYEARKRLIRKKQRVSNVLRILQRSRYWWKNIFVSQHVENLHQDKRYKFSKEGEKKMERERQIA